MNDPNPSYFDPNKKTTAWKIATIVLSVFLLGSLLLNVQYFKQLKKEEEQFKVFVNQVYSALKDAERIVSSLTSKDNWRENVSDPDLFRFAHSLYHVHYKLQEGAYYLKGVYGGVFDIYEDAANLLVYGGSLQQLHIPPFIGKSALTTEEARFIEGLGQLLADILEDMNVGRQDNGQVKLSKHVFNRILGEYSIHSKLYPLLERSFEEHQQPIDELQQTQLSLNASAM